MINIKNRSYYFYNYIISLHEFDGSNIKTDRRNFNDIDIYYFGYENKKKNKNYRIQNVKYKIKNTK